jgi:branched-subunit amino acid aminotransferase/4-amino-4-deoxychorismate lyase
VFIVSGGRVATPALDQGALPGITRARVLELCREGEIPAEERPIGTRELRTADEIFVTSALRGVVAITRLDDVSRLSGPITTQLAAAYAHRMRTA